jgi:peptidoglycan hydrolase-like protein with peptidoglycan-binding domain
MARSVRPAEPDEVEDEGLMRQALARLGGAVVRNPSLVGATTAFAVTLSFVSANALWYQPHAHLGALFPTRGFGSAMVPKPSIGDPTTTIRIERPEAANIPTVDPQVEHVQKILAMLNLYQGKADGISGPNTRRAIADYQKLMGLKVDGEVDDGLLRLLAAEERAIKLPADARTSAAPAEDEAPSGPQTGSIVPQPAPRPIVTKDEPKPAPDPRIAKIQAGLRAFGNPGLELDGVAGARTRAAIKEFQALFGLPETGEPDDAVYAKMHAEGYIN